MGAGRASFGEVEVDLGDETVALRPTLKAFNKLLRRWPRGVPEIMEQLGAMDPNQVAFIVSAATDANKEEAAQMPDRVFRAGVGIVAAQVAPYLSLLLNPTGRDPDAEEDPPKGGDDDSGEP